MMIGHPNPAALSQVFSQWYTGDSSNSSMSHAAPAPTPSDAKRLADHQEPTKGVGYLASFKVYLEQAVSGVMDMINSLLGRTVEPVPDKIQPLDLNQIRRANAELAFTIIPKILKEAQTNPWVGDKALNDVHGKLCDSNGPLRRIMTQLQGLVGADYTPEITSEIKKIFDTPIAGIGFSQWATPGGLASHLLEQLNVDNNLDANLSKEELDKQLVARETLQQKIKMAGQEIDSMVGPIAAILERCRTYKETGIDSAVTLKVNDAVDLQSEA